MNNYYLLIIYFAYIGCPLNTVMVRNTVERKPITSCMCPLSSRCKNNGGSTGCQIAKFSGKKREGFSSSCKKCICLPEENKYKRSVNCNPIQPQIVLFNRVPKIGGTAVVKRLHDMKWRRDVRFPKYAEHARWNPWHRRFYIESLYGLIKSPTDAKGLKLIVSRFWTQNHTILEGHVFFTEFDVGKRPAMINFVRNPVDRVISQFNYKRFGSRPGVLASRYRAAAGKMTLTTCVEQVLFNSPQLLAKGIGNFSGAPKMCIRDIFSSSQWRYFCGMSEKYCPGIGDEGVVALFSNARRRGLERAKRNLLKWYAFVGLTENFELSIKALEKILPHYFTGFFNQSFDSISMQSINNNSYELPPPKIMKILRHLLHFEMEFYYFARNIFMKKIACLGL